MALALLECVSSVRFAQQFSFAKPPDAAEAELPRSKETVQKLNWN
jgi:hypothetical protein